MEKSSLGVRLNNPCNIRYNGIKWDGLAYPSRVNGFCKFHHPVYGVRAFLVILRTYVTKHHIKTVCQFVNRYAPAGDGNNNPDKYCALIIGALRIHSRFDIADRDDLFDISLFTQDPDGFSDRFMLLYFFSKAVAKVESGFELSLYMFREAYCMI